MAKRSIAKILTTAVLTVLAVILLLSGFFTDGAHSSAPSDSVSVRLMQDEGAKTVLASTGGTEYTVIFSSDTMPLDQTLAKNITTLMYELYGQRAQLKADSAVRAGEKEILIGTTNRSESKTFAAALSSMKSADDDLVYGYCMMNGKLLYTATDSIAFEYGMQELLTYLAENNFTVPSTLSVMKIKSRADYDAEMKELEELENQKILAELRAMNSKFTQDQFGGDPLSMTPSPYNAPVLYPAAGMHPRIFITEDKLDDVRAIMEDPAYAKLVRTFYNDVNMAREDVINGFPTVYFDDPKDLYEDDYYRYDVDIISALQNKAFAYLITGNEIYGYEAIIGAKNMILTLKYSTYIHMDLYHGASHVMIAVAKIYDWCYDLMTEDDKMQIAAGISRILAPQMEAGMRFPPSGMSAVSGHGTGPQFLRDWMMVSISLYDEMPDWWDFIGGRYFQYYVPVVNESTKNGWVTQGTSCYGPGKFSETMISARLLYLSTGQIPYDEEGIKLAPYYVISHLQGNGKYFQTGDGSRNPTGGSLQYSFLYDIASIYGDPVLTGYLYSITNRMNDAAKPDWDNDAPAAKILAYLAYLPEPATDALDQVETIQYFAHPAGSMTARTSWDSDAAVFFMRMGTMTMANHDIYDSGTFQIYYKGLLAGTTGSYSKYGSNVHKYYLQATVAQNGLLVFNPSHSDAEPDIGADGDPLNILNGATYFYSGGQTRRGEAGTIENWLGGNYNMGSITGYSKGYSFGDGSPEYGYIAGDITSAYDSDTVEYLERRMLTIFTGDAEVPALFFTFDTMDAKQENFGKTFLLHTINEPTVDEDNMSANIIAGEGRLYMQSLYGADKIEKVGGAGYAYWINGYYDNDGKWVDGRNCVDTYCPNDNADRFWGRVQLLASGEKVTQMLTAMLVTDASNKKTVAFEKFSSDSVYGAKYNDIYAVFVNTREREYKQFSFTTEGKGLSKYYISGIEAGTWRVLVDGVRVASVAVTEDGGFASFIAPSGNITLEPTSNVLGANGGKIQYTTGGGVLGDDTEYTYHNETATPITATVTRGSDLFLGWYTTPTCDKGTEITEIPAGTIGTVRLYAKWLSTFANESFDETSITLDESSMTVNGINYNGGGKTGSSFKTVKDDSGSYLVWTKGSKDPLISVTSTVNNFSTMTTDDETVSFEFEVAKNGDATIMPFHLRIMSNIEYRTNANGVWGEYVVFTVEDTGVVHLGSANTPGPVIGDISDGKILKIKIAVDFKNGRVIAYSSNGAEYASMDITVPSGSKAPTASDWRKLMTQYLAYIYPNGTGKADSSIRIHSLKISESNVLENKDLADYAINYDMGGGTLPESAPFYYSNDMDTTLPTPTKNNAEFCGWYTTPDFKAGTEITAIPKDSKGPFKVYAKWAMTFVDTDFTGSSVNATESGNVNFAGMTFQTTGKTGASFTTKTDANGKTYIEFVKGSKDPLIAVKSNSENFSTMSSGMVSYSFAFSKKAGADILASSDILLESNVSATGQSGVWGTLHLFYINEDGSVTASNSTALGTIVEDDILYVNFSIDFENGIMTYYDEKCDVITAFKFTAPAKSGASSTAEWQRLIKQYMLYFRANNNNCANDSALNIYGITIKEGDIFKSRAIPDGNEITYKTNGGTLPDGAPGTYDAAKGTILPTDVKRDGYIFGGWYTDALFAGERVDYIPAGSTKCITLYAKWTKIVLDEDYSSTEVDVGESSTSLINGINYNAGSENEPKPGSFHKTEKDESGNTYLKSATAGKATIACVSSNSYNLTHFANPEISFELSLAKAADIPLGKYSLSLATSGDNYGEKFVFTVDPTTGAVKLSGSTKPIAVITESFATLRITVSFKEETITAYDENNKIIDTVSLGAVPKSREGKTQPTTWLEWQSLASNYLFYGMLLKPDDLPAGEISAILFDGFKIYDGCPFIRFATDLPSANEIKLVTNGGMLADDFPTEYEPGEAITLPTPERTGSMFCGWYTTKDFKEGTRVTEIPAGYEGLFTAYAKWSNIFVYTDFVGSDLNVDSTAGANYDGVGLYTSGKAGSSFITKTDADGKTYLEWTKGSSDSLFSVQNSSSNFSTMSATAASYSIKLRKDADAPLLATSQIVLESNVDASGNGKWATLELLKITAEGNVICPVDEEQTVITTITDDKVTDIRFVIDFENGKIVFYSEANEVLHTVSFAAPEGCGTESTAEWQRLIKRYMLYVRANDSKNVTADSKLLIYGLTIAEGNIYQ